MLKKYLFVLFACLFITSQMNAQDEEESKKWFFLDLSLEATYLKTTTEEITYLPSLEIKIKKFDNIKFGLEGSYYGNKVLYDGAANSEVIKMGEVLGKIDFSSDSGISLGFEVGKRFGEKDFDGIGGAVNLYLPYKEAIALEGSFSYDKNEYTFGLIKIEEKTLDIDADLDITLSDAISWIVGVNYNATEYAPTVGTYTLYNAYTKIYAFIGESVVANIGVKLGRDSSSYTILGINGGINLTLSESFALNFLGNYTLYSKELLGSDKKGKNSPYGGSSSFSNYSITGGITFSF